MQGRTSKRDHHELATKTIGLAILPRPSGANICPVSNLIEILSNFTRERIPLVTGGTLRVFESDVRVRFCGVEHRSGNNVASRILRYIKMQMRMTQRIAESSHIDTWIFFTGGETLALAMIMAKLFHKRTIIVLSAHIITDMVSTSNRFVTPIKILIMVTLRFCERIVVYSPRLITEWNLEKYRHKILIAHRHFLDFNTFTVTTPLPDRAPLIGYIGRLSGEKGVQHFAQALPAILSDRQDLRVLIGGDGQLKEAIEASLQEQGVSARVDLPGWISHDDLPGYLNQLRLLVLPSYTEGLPNIMLEAMACGNLSVCESVGAMPGDSCVAGI